MTKKKQPLEEIYIIIDEDEKYQGKYDTLVEAENVCDREDYGNAQIMRVVQVWSTEYPPEPEMEFREVPLDEV